MLSPSASISNSLPLYLFFFFFFFNDTATTEIYTLSLHDALPISTTATRARSTRRSRLSSMPRPPLRRATRSEEHTSELQSRRDLVCRLLLEKKKKLHTQQRARMNSLPLSLTVCARSYLHNTHSAR